MKSTALKTVCMSLTLLILCFTFHVQSQTKSTQNALKVSFADKTWDGITVPEGQQCHRFGGINPSTPSLVVANIPKAANAIIMEFNDKTFTPNDNGGHGKVGYNLAKNKKKVVIPSAPAHTSDLPEPFFVVAEHRAPKWDIPGAYLPPCSGGKGNTYSVTVKAVRKTAGNDFEVLAEAELILGKF